MGFANSGGGVTAMANVMFPEWSGELNKLRRGLLPSTETAPSPTAGDGGGMGMDGSPNDPGSARADTESWKDVGVVEGLARAATNAFAVASPMGMIGVAKGAMAPQNKSLSFTFDAMEGLLGRDPSSAFDGPGFSPEGMKAAGFDRGMDGAFGYDSEADPANADPNAANAAAFSNANFDGAYDSGNFGADGGPSGPSGGPSGPGSSSGPGAGQGERDSSPGMGTGDPSVGSGGNSDGADSRVICTHFHRRGDLPRDLWLADMRWTLAHCSPQTVRGYHAWAIPAVRLMRRGGRAGRLLEAVLRPVCIHRAREIARLAGDRAQGDALGELFRLVLEPASWLIGAFVGRRHPAILKGERHARG